MAVEFTIDQTPNPNALKFSASQPLFEGRLSYRQGDSPDDAVASALLNIEGVDSIFGFQDFITVNKTVEADWNTIVPKVQEVFENAY
ncbi:NifU N-terminal domain-containing protein [Pseudalkalibacillus berkeleyi]|uniref:NifU N-terminal domain-containing protein n=1 Tax=Pseudalkalibacillus berkeleyi TaxID=1069813 RepID=A0ABS9GVF1_9BACL|nr:NifU N-terminal domain-containing protein [Pseudalkalibacillus berkeleyi]MCF6136804.1 NifU N-terminal domain-containing protein [Pseudalkalibacillus berkeleyi]